MFLTQRECRSGANCRNSGFSLIELMIVVAIIAILAAIALPSYTRYVIRTHRAAAEGCLSELGNFMERYYTTNLRYDQDTDDTAVALPDLECRSAAQTGPFYTYQFAPNQPAQATFILQAVPQGSQATGDAQCGTLTLDQTGKRDITGDGPVSDCWR